MSQYIFGEIDVPRLDTDSSPISPFDMSRSMRLNPNNELVRAILAFLGQSIEEVRRELAQAEKRRRAHEEAKKLAKQASEIARVINEDFDAFRRRLAQARGRASGGGDFGRNEAGGGQGSDDIDLGTTTPAEVIAPTGGIGSSGGHGGNGTTPRHLNPKVAVAGPDAPKQGRPAGGTDGHQKPSGGFLVKFDDMGVESPRAKYVRDERTIYINLDHPQLAAAKGLGSIDEPVFRRLAYEVAFSEYAIALASDLAAQGDFVDPSDAIVEIRDTLNRVARKGAALYSA